VTLGELAKYSMTRSVARSLCYSWASCFQYRANIMAIFRRGPPNEGAECR